MKNDIKKRVVQVLKYKKINVNRASKILGIPQRTLNRQVNEDGNVGIDLVNAILNNYTEISPAWLVLGEGDMLQKENVTVNSGVPFYNEQNSKFI